MPPYYFMALPNGQFPLFSLDRLKSSFELLVQLCQISSVRQNRLDQGLEEDTFRERCPTRAVNDFQKLPVVLIAWKAGDRLLHFAQFSLESPHLIGRWLGLRFCESRHVFFRVHERVLVHQG